jgi:isocitrate/isopropylmalate dehydrogenase
MEWRAWSTEGDCAMLRIRKKAQERARLRDGSEMNSMNKSLVAKESFYVWQRLIYQWASAIKVAEKGPIGDGGLDL